MVKARVRTRQSPPSVRREGVTRRRRGAVKSMTSADVHMEALQKAVNQSQQLDDPFRDRYGIRGAMTGENVIVEPPYNFASLLRLPRENNMLRQCIDAMVTNVDGHGWRLEYTGPDGQDESDAANSEKVTLENLLEFPNDSHSLQELRERIRRDMETIGNAFLEVGRDAVGRICLVAHVPGDICRLTTMDDEAVPVRVRLPREGEGSEQTVNKRFRRIVQAIGARKVYFKEFGDPRTIDPKTGRVNDELAMEEAATEVIHRRVYAPGTPYGIPRWINQLPAILGSRQSELTNLDFFNENAIPAMALLVSGGMVTQSTLDDIEEQFIVARGREAMNRVLVIEAHGDENAASKDGNIPAPRLELKPMQNERMKDALFQEYDRNNGTKVRSSFRLPPIFVGLAQDYTHATAKTSFEVAESQVFGPERAKDDDVWNMKVLATYDPKFWSFRSMPPRISDPADVIKAIKSFDEVGAMTPNVAIGLANDFFDLEIPNVEEDWGNLPFSIIESLIDAGAIPEGIAEMANIGEAVGDAAESVPQASEPNAPTSAGPAQDDGVEEARTTMRRVSAQIIGLGKSAQRKPPRRRTRALRVS